MKYGALFFLAACCLLLGGCSQLPSQATGPQGGGEPLPLGDEGQAPRSALPPRPMGRRRRNAAAGRSVAPGENAACCGCGCGGSCDYPLWLDEAQKKQGLYLRCECAAADYSGAEAGGSAETARLRFSRFPAEALPLAAVAGQGAQAAVSADASCSALFAAWCLSRAVNPKSGRAYGQQGAAVLAENWLHYGAAAQPCLGALMVAEDCGGYCFAFCLGALTLPQAGAQAETIYLGLGVKRAGALEGNQIGLVALKASAVAAFRLPQNYVPCKEHFKLSETFWAEQFKAELALRQKQRQAQADNAPSRLRPPISQNQAQVFFAPPQAMMQTAAIQAGQAMQMGQAGQMRQAGAQHSSLSSLPLPRSGAGKGFYEGAAEWNFAPADFA